jgi:hypothetical protein
MNQSIIDILTIVAAVIVGIVASARVTRLVVADTFPPLVWLRIKYEDHAGEARGKLLTCPWCFGPYVTLLDLAWYLLSSDSEFWREAWWVTNGWLAAAYAESWIVFHDED